MTFTDCLYTEFNDGTLAFEDDCALACVRHCQGANWLDDEDAFQYMCRLMRDPAKRPKEECHPSTRFRGSEFDFGKGGQACMWLPIAPGLPLCTRLTTRHQERVPVRRVLRARPYLGR